MTSKERLLCAYRQGMPDRVPVYIRGVYPYLPGWMDSKHESFKRLSEYVAEKCDLQLTWSPPQGIFMSASDEVRQESRIKERLPEWEVHERIIQTPKGLLSSTTRVSTIGHPSLRDKPLVESEEDVEKVLSVPYVPMQPDVSPFFQMERLLGDRGVVMACFPCALMCLADLMNSETMAIWSKTNRKRILQLLEIFNDRIYAKMKYVLDRGVGPVIGLIGEEYATPPLLSPKDFEEFVVQFDRRLIELAHSYNCIVRIHCHGNLNAVLEKFVDMGTDALHPVETKPMGDITLEDFRLRVGNNITIKGNIQVGDLYTCSPKEIEEKCKETIRVGGKDGALILAPSASPYLPVLTDRVFENYKTMIDTALNYGEYPLE